MATLTSVYADSTIVLGPLATEAQPEAPAEEMALNDMRLLL